MQERRPGIVSLASDNASTEAMPDTGKPARGNMMEGIRVEITINGYIAVSGFFPHLDSVIAYIAMEREECDMESLPLEKFIPDDDDIKDLWVWKASALVPDRVLRRSALHCIRRYDDMEIQDAYEKGLVRSRGPENYYSGPLRPHVLSMPIMYVNTLTGWCVGDMQKIKDLLKDLDHVGKLRRIGIGRVNGIEIIPDDDAHVKWQIRAMPQRLSGYVPVMTTIRPPYWLRSERKVAFVPPSIVA